MTQIKQATNHAITAVRKTQQAIFALSMIADYLRSWPGLALIQQEALYGTTERLNGLLHERLTVEWRNVMLLAPVVPTTRRCSASIAAACSRPSTPRCHRSMPLPVSTGGPMRRSSARRCCKCSPARQKQSRRLRLLPSYRTC